MSPAWIMDGDLKVVCFHVADITYITYISAWWDRGPVGRTGKVWSPWVTEIGEQ